MVPGAHGHNGVSALGTATKVYGYDLGFVSIVMVILVHIHVVIINHLAMNGSKHVNQPLAITILCGPLGAIGLVVIRVVQGAQNDGKGFA